MKKASTELLPPTLMTTSTRAFIQIKGVDRKIFLNGLVTNDIFSVSANKTLYSALLNPQGKYLHDFFVIEIEETLLIDLAFEELEEFIKRLKIYKLRSNVEIMDVTQNWQIQYFKLNHFSNLFPQFAKKGFERGDTFYDAASGWFIVDPRHESLGIRWLYQGPFKQNVPQDYFFTKEEQEKNRILLAVPKGRVDLIPDKSFPLENNFDEMGAISWKKGCYVGQEVTARMKYRLSPKKKLLTIWLAHPIIAERQKIIRNDQQEVGEICSTYLNWGLALWRLEYLANDQEPFPTYFVSFQNKQIKVNILHITNT